MDKGAWWATVHGAAKDYDMTERLSNNKQLIVTATTCISTELAKFKVKGTAFYVKST